MVVCARASLKRDPPGRPRPHLPRYGRARSSRECRVCSQLASHGSLSATAPEVDSNHSCGVLSDCACEGSISRCCHRETHPLRPPLHPLHPLHRRRGIPDQPLHTTAVQRRRQGSRRDTYSSVGFRIMDVSGGARN